MNTIVLGTNDKWIKELKHLELTILAREDLLTGSQSFLSNMTFSDFTTNVPLGIEIRND